eukprot:scaffold20104_cov120-Isochrysis_galbana.AAC.9
MRLSRLRFSFGDSTTKPPCFFVLLPRHRHGASARPARHNVPVGIPALTACALFSLAAACGPGRRLQQDAEERRQQEEQEEGRGRGRRPGVGRAECQMVCSMRRVLLTPAAWMRAVPSAGWSGPREAFC